MIDIDLSGGHVTVLGNRGDTHLFRLSNPLTEPIIVPEGTYEIVFEKHLGPTTTVALDLSELASGVLIFPLVVSAGTYVVRRTDIARRTILTVDVEVK